MKLALTIDATKHEIESSPSETLLAALRELGYHGVKFNSCPRTAKRRSRYLSRRMESRRPLSCMRAYLHYKISSSNGQRETSY